MRKDVEEFSHYKRATSRGGVPFLAKTSKNGKCHVHWSDGTLADYGVFQRIFNGSLGKHMESQLKGYFDSLSTRSKAEFGRGGCHGHFGPIDCEMASDVFAVVMFHFNTALEWMAESEIQGSWTEEKRKARDEYVDKKNAEFGAYNDIEVEPQKKDAELAVNYFQDCSDEEYPARVSEYESLVREGFEIIDDSAPWAPRQSDHEEQSDNSQSDQTDIQQIAYRVFELIEPALKQAVAQAIDEHLK